MKRALEKRYIKPTFFYSFFNHNLNHNEGFFVTVLIGNSRTSTLFFFVCLFGFCLYLILLCYVFVCLICFHFVLGCGNMNASLYQGQLTLLFLTWNKVLKKSPIANVKSNKSKTALRLQLGKQKALTVNM